MVQNYICYINKKTYVITIWYIKVFINLKCSIKENAKYIWYIIRMKILTLKAKMQELQNCK